MLSTENPQNSQNSSNPLSVSIHIVTYNSAAHIADCLQAVYKQTYPLAQVVIVDNASTDATRSLLKPYAEQALIVFNARNRGFAPAHNQALELTTSAYCLVLNPDVILQPDYVAQLVEAMRQAPRIGSATGKLLLQSSPGLIDSTGLEINKARRAFDRKAGQKDAVAIDEPMEIFGVSGAAAMYSRKMITDVMLDKQFFDEAFFAYKEDVDVAWRAQLLGWLAVYVSQAIAYHERGWKSGSRSKQPLFIRRHSYINRYRMILKNDRFSYIVRHMVHVLSFELASFIYILFREPLLLVSWGKLFYDLPHLLHQRREIQRRSKVEARKVYHYFR